MKIKITNKIIIFFVLTLIILLSNNFFNFANNLEIIKFEEKINQKNNFKFINSGTMSSACGLSTTYTLNSKNGKYVIFYVRNLCEQPIRISITSINYKNSKILEKGKSDYIYTQLPYFFSKKIKCNSNPANGGKIKFYFEIIQGDNKYYIN